jgi:hypothetical protein
VGNVLLQQQQQQHQQQQTNNQAIYHETRKTASYADKGSKQKKMCIYIIFNVIARTLYSLSKGQ